jgi:hypothetical protein
MVFVILFHLSFFPLFRSLTHSLSRSLIALTLCAVNHKPFDIYNRQTKRKGKSVEEREKKTAAAAHKNFTQCDLYRKEKSSAKSGGWMPVRLRVGVCC